MGGGGVAVSESDSEGQQHLLSSSQFRQAKKHFYSTPDGLLGTGGGKGGPGKTETSLHTNCMYRMTETKFESTQG